ncbi:type II secretion system F family protein [Leekyejoonella antrihumi]|uniref:Type II secretion system protein GspF domain-containing protein n=1 Tax=Leekyejoonella antrihumi TaxID=1660198 RepID=A0A563DW07_9MICO|nr:hypothetical protein [Leekyejoonella antrihumi]TWP34460.1 hypothetical protein FGL98_17235 [Leekyejoonella antrihumi]
MPPAGRGLAALGGPIMSGAVLIVGIGTVLLLGAAGLLAATLCGVDVLGGGTPAGRPDRWRPTRTHAIALGVGVVMWLVSAWPVMGLATGVLVLLMPDLLARKSGTQVHNELLGALAGWVRRLADLMRSGAVTSLQDALVRSADTAPELVAGPVRRLAARIGPQGPETALLAFADEVADPIGDRIVMALLIRHRQGGSGLPDVLTQLAAEIDVDIQGQRQTDAERYRLVVNVRVLVVLTVVMWVGAKFFMGTLMAHYDTVTGQLELAAVLGLFLVSMMWIRAKVRFVGGARLLGDQMKVRP